MLKVYIFDKTQFHHPSFEPLINETKKKQAVSFAFIMVGI